MHGQETLEYIESSLFFKAVGEGENYSIAPFREIDFTIGSGG